MIITELAAGKGLPARIFQGGWIDEPNKLVTTVPQPFGIVSLAIDRTIDKGGYSDLISQRTFLLDHFIDDGKSGLIATNKLVAIIDFLQTYLDDGVNIYVHCIAGQSRSSYVLAALLSRVLNITTEDALEIIFTERPGAKEYMQECFITHLKSIGTFAKQDTTILNEKVIITKHGDTNVISIEPNSDPTIVTVSDANTVPLTTANTT